MHEFHVPIRQANGWPKSLGNLSNHLNLASSRPGVIGFGMFVDPPDEHSMASTNVEKPFFVVRDDTGDARTVDLHDMEGQSLLADCPFVDKLLLVMTDKAFRTMLTHHLFHIYWSDYPDDAVDVEGSGEIVETLIITDGRAITAWNAERALKDILACHAAPLEDDEEEDDLDEPIEDFLCVVVPEATSAHDKITLTSNMKGPLAVINELALNNNSEFKFIFDPNQV